MASTDELSRAKTDFATTIALDNHEVQTVTLVIMVRRDNKLAIYQEDCRPANRAAVLSRYGVDINRPLRSPRHAYAWVDANGVLQVGGTSEKGKERLRSMYQAILVSREDLELI